MAELDMNIGFIGAGNMGEAIIGALVSSNIFSPERVCSTDLNKDRLKVIAEKYGTRTAQTNISLFSQSDIVVLAIKPQQMEAVLSEIASHEDYGVSKRKLIISIAAGIRMEKIEKLLYSSLDPDAQALMPVVRVMPNTPALVLSGMSGVSGNSHATQQDMEVTLAILASMGKAIRFKEDDLDAVTAVSGSGPAYVFYFIESMIQGGVENGLSREDAEVLTLETIKGAVKLMEEQKESPEELRRKVTSPGGTTEAAVKVFKEKGFKETVIRAVDAAAQRSKELSG